MGVKPLWPFARNRPRPVPLVEGTGQPDEDAAEAEDKTDALSMSRLALRLPGSRARIYIAEIRMRRCHLTNLGR